MAHAQTFRSGNPALGANTFSGFSGVSDSATMTLGGTVNKTALSLLILLVTASVVWNRGAADPSLWTFVMVGSGALSSRSPRSSGRPGRL